MLLEVVADVHTHRCVQQCASVGLSLLAKSLNGSIWHEIGGLGLWALPPVLQVNHMCVSVPSALAGQHATRA